MFTDNRKAKAITALAIFVAVLIAVGAWFIANGNTAEPAPTHRPESTIYTPPEPDERWTQILELREHPVFAEQLLFSCSTREGVYFLNSQPEDRQLHSPALSVSELNEGGVSVSFGDPECLHPVATTHEMTDEEFTNLMNESQEMMDSYGLPQPTAIEDGKYVVQVLPLNETPDTPLTYVGVATLAEHISRANTPSGSLHNPSYITNEQVKEVSDVLKVLSHADEETLRSLVVSEEALTAVHGVLTYTVAHTGAKTGIS